MDGRHGADPGGIVVLPSGGGTKISDRTCRISPSWPGRSPSRLARRPRTARASGARAIPACGKGSPTLTARMPVRQKRPPPRRVTRPAGPPRRRAIQPESPPVPPVHTLAVVVKQEGSEVALPPGARAFARVFWAWLVNTTTPIFVVVDGHPTHRAKSVARFVAAQERAQSHVHYVHRHCLRIRIGVPAQRPDQAMPAQIWRCSRRRSG
jgi:hypothetical protein